MSDRMVFPIEETPDFWDDMHMESEAIRAEPSTFEQTYHLPPAAPWVHWTADEHPATDRWVIRR